MTHVTTRDQRRQLARDNAKLSAALQKIPRSDWPEGIPGILEAWRSRDFLVQVYAAPEPAMARISVNRTELNATGRWVDGISWDDLQRIKTEVGYGDFDAVEVYPPGRDVVNVANIRHLWVLGSKLSFAWRKT